LRSFLAIWNSQSSNPSDAVWHAKLGRHGFLNCRWRRFRLAQNRFPAAGVELAQFAFRSGPLEIRPGTRVFQPAVRVT